MTWVSSFISPGVRLYTRKKTCVACPCGQERRKRGKEADFQKACAERHEEMRKACEKVDWHGQIRLNVHPSHETSYQALSTGSLSIGFVYPCLWDLGSYFGAFDARDVAVLGLTFWMAGLRICHVAGFGTASMSRSWFELGKGWFVWNLCRGAWCIFMFTSPSLF